MSLQRLALLLGLPLLFLPKINLIDAFGTNAGVRIDDLLLLMLTPLILSARLLSKEAPSRIEKLALSITIAALFSWGLNLLFCRFGWIHLSSNPLFVVRFAEYFTFFYIGRAAAEAVSVERLLWVLIAINAVWMLLQWREWVGAFGVYGYTSSHLRRPSGLFGNAAECALVLNIVCAYLLTLRQNRSILLLLLFAPLLFLTEARISQAAFGLLTVGLMARRRLGGWLIGGVVASVIVFALFHSERSGNLFSKKNVEIVSNLYREIDIEGQDFQRASVVNRYQQQLDMSWFMRVRKWLFVAKYFLHHPSCWPFGLGPGVCLNALDGGLLRLLVEGGVVGFLLWVWLFWSIGRLSRPMRWVVFLFLVNMIFIDSHISYKPMALLLCLAGVEGMYGEGERGKRATSVGRSGRARGVRSHDDRPAPISQDSDPAPGQALSR